MSWFVEGLTYVLSTVGALLPIVNPLSAVGLVVLLMLPVAASITVAGLAARGVENGLANLWGGSSRARATASWWRASRT